jgi:hypothetical protein
MRRIRSVVIALALTETLLISKFENASGTRGARRVEATMKKSFMRMLSYYEIRSQTVCPSGVLTKMNAMQPAAAAHRRVS